MLRRIVGITGISLWAGLIVVTVVGGLEGKANGERMFENLPEGWKVEKSFIVPKDQITAFSRKFGARISKLSNTYLSIEGKPLQVNIIECVTPCGAEKIYNSILGMKSDPAFCLKYGDTVVEFVGGDVKLAKKAVYELGIKPRPIETMAKDFIQLLADGDFSKATENFDDTMKKAAPPEKLRQIWNSLVAQHGQFEKQLDTRMKTIVLYKAVFVACQFEKMVVDLQVTFNTANQIAGFHIAQIRPKANQQKQVSKDSRLGQKALASRE